MEDVEEMFTENICIFCLNHECKNKKNCKNIVNIKRENLESYKCVNFIKKYRAPKEFSEFIRYAFYNEDGKYIVIIKPETPKYVVHQMKYRFDEVKYRE